MTTKNIALKMGLPTLALVSGLALTVLPGCMPSQPATDDAMMQNDAMMSVTMKDGEMMTVDAEGTMKPMESDMTMDNGTKVMMDGKVMMSDGSTTMMKEGEVMEKSGEMMTDDAMTDEDAEEGVMVGGAMMVRSRNIVENASLADNVTTLVAAVKAAALVETLSGPGPFTVFAPTNDAFAKLPAGTVDTLLKAESKDKLTGILTYHVVSGTYMASDLKDGMTLKTVNGGEITLTEKDGKWWINGTAQVEIADVVSSNGVTHVIDSVLLPE